ncbi:MAG TPA: AEC family transporter [Stellaceae bacterium]|nr:AEC family transporter [Stellaceae bacterium]
MLATILTAIAPVIITALLGFGWTRLGRSFDAQALTHLVTEIGTPCLVFSTFAKMTVPPSAFAVTAAASLTILVGFLAVASAILKLCGLSLRTYLPSMAFPNTGNLGMPLALYAFGPEGLAYAIVFLTFTSILNFTIGQAIAAGTMSWRGLLRMPIIYAVALGLATSAFDIAVPPFLGNTIALLGSITVPLMLLMLGVSIGSLRVAAFARAFWLSLLRIGMGASIGFAVTAIFGLHGAARAALVMQSAMPAAVFNYLFALRWNNQPEEVAGIVVVSTLITIATAPTLLYFLLG